MGELMTFRSVGRNQSFKLQAN